MESNEGFVQAAANHGGRVVALGTFREAVGDGIEPRKVLILVEWESKEAFEGYCNDRSLSTMSDFSNLTAIFINPSLKKDPEPGQ